jgi:hypothetical protein
MNISKRLVSRSWFLLAMFTLSLVGLVWAATPHCPSGFTLEADGSKCVRAEPPSCKAGYTQPSGETKCQKLEGQPVICPEGMSYFSFQGKGNCVSSIEPTISCPSGYTYHQGRKQCQRLQVPTCSSGSHLNSGADHCVKVITDPLHCTSGLVYNAGKNVCEEFATPSCAVAGQILSQGQCVSPRSGKGHEQH